MKITNREGTQGTTMNSNAHEEDEVFLAKGIRDKHRGFSHSLGARNS